MLTRRLVELDPGALLLLTTCELLSFFPLRLLYMSLEQCCFVSVQECGGKVLGSKSAVSVIRCKCVFSIHYSVISSALA